MTEPEDGAYVWVSKTGVDMPQEYHEHALLALRRKASNELYAVLLLQKSPVVVEIEEKANYWQGSIRYPALTPMHEFRITARMTQVKYRDVTLSSFAPPDASCFQPPTPAKPSKLASVIAWIKSKVLSAREVIQ